MFVIYVCRWMGKKTGRPNPARRPSNVSEASSTGTEKSGEFTVYKS
jgi:hypothetical protein